MNEAATRSGEYSTSAPVMYVAFELGEKRWQVGFTTGFGQRARRRWISARSVERLGVELEAARERFGLPISVPVVSCYEAGRDDFWLHRYLASAGVENVVVDAASIEVPRPLRRAKTDRLDLESLLRLLIRHHAGERSVWRIVNVPSRAIEDARQLHRDVEVLKRDRTRVTNRIKGLLAGQGVSGISLGPGFEAALDELRLWDGSGLPTQLKARLVREWTRGRDLTERIRENEKLRASLLAESEDPAMEQVRQLMRLRGVGLNGAWLLVMEFFAWRNFGNRRELGALAGLTPTPHQSGGPAREQGISKAGNRRVRWLMIQLAWSWLRHQPDSALSRWFEEKYGAGSRRIRRIGIVALARKLLIALWLYLETRTPPEGAELKV